VGLLISIRRVAIFAQGLTNVQMTETVYHHIGLIQGLACTRAVCGLPSEMNENGF
jgi:hypothetical protein